MLKSYLNPLPNFFEIALLDRESIISQDIDPAYASITNAHVSRFTQDLNIKEFVLSMK